MGESCIRDLPNEDEQLQGGVYPEYHAVRADGIFGTEQTLVEDDPDLLSCIDVYRGPSATHWLRHVRHQ